MSQITSMFGHLPGMGTLVETFEQAYAWGPYPRYYTGAYIGSTCADPTNSPTWELRPGLILGKQVATGTYVNYNPQATDGSEVASAVLPLALRMQDVLTGVNTTKFYAAMVSGGVQAAKLIGLDNQARAQMSGTFYFDDNLPGNHVFPWQRFQNKTANYTVQASDNLSLFYTLGATAEVDFTLPAIAQGYYFGFACQAGFVMKVISFEGANVIMLNNLVANGAAFSTASQEIGGIFYVFSIISPSGTLKWVVVNNSAGTNAVSIL